MQKENIDRLDVNEKMELLSDYTQKVVNDFLSLYKRNRNNYASAVTDLFYKDIGRDNVETLNINDYNKLQNMHDLNTTPHSYKKTFLWYIYTYNIIQNAYGFDKIFHKEKGKIHFEKRKLGKKQKEHKDEKVRLTLEQIMQIEQVIEQLRTNEPDKYNEKLKLPFLWDMLFDKGCGVREVVGFTSEDFDGTYITSNLGKKYKIEQEHKKLMDKLDTLDYKGISVNNLVKKLGEYAGIENLMPIDIKIARQQNMIKCSNCRVEYTNSDKNWRTIDNRVICVECSEKILKKNNNSKIKRISRAMPPKENEVVVNKISLLKFEEWNPEQDLLIKQKQESNDLIGKNNELLVRNYLENRGYVVKKVSHNEGFDFHVYNDSRQFVVEVKTMNSLNEFTITSNELLTLNSERLGSLYKIFLVKNGTIFIIDDFMELAEKNSIQGNSFINFNNGNVRFTYERITIGINSVVLEDLRKPL